MKDLSTVQHSITSKVEALIGKMEKMEDMTIRREFLSILSDPDTHVSDETKKKWFTSLANKPGKKAVMFAITNLYLGGCNLKVCK